MTHIDQIVADALAGSPETHVAILAREVVRLREAPAVVAPELTDDDLNRYSMDCDERDALEFGYKLAASRFASAGRTVIPPLTDDEIEERYRSLTNGTDELEREWCYKDCRWAYSLAVYRARVAVAGSMLGIGMVAVGREEFEGATRWTFGGIDVHKIEHKKGFWFAVRRENSCMSRVGKWDFEPLPSSRTPEFFAEFRFDTFRDALIALRANQGGANHD